MPSELSDKWKRKPVSREWCPQKAYNGRSVVSKTRSMFHQASQGTRHIRYPLENKINPMKSARDVRCTSPAKPCSKRHSNEDSRASHTEKLQIIRENETRPWQTTEPPQTRIEATSKWRAAWSTNSTERQGPKNETTHMPQYRSNNVGPNATRRKDNYPIGASIRRRQLIKKSPTQNYRDA